MLALTILSIFILLILLLIFIEYRNEKKYQEKRRAEAQQKRRPRKKLKVKKVERKREPAPKPKPEPIPEAEHTPEPEIIPEPIQEPEPIAEPVAIPKPKEKTEVEIPQEIKQLPEANYPHFSHARLVDMGLSDEEAREFVTELIPQLEIQIPLIEESMKIPDFHQMERLTHSIKGSATNIGTGGVSDLLVDWNTYLKTGTDSDIAKAYFDHMVHYTAELKAQYS